MKIKVIDLINKVEKREEMPKKVKFNGNIYKWCEDIGDYRKDGWGHCLMAKDILDNFGKYGSFYNMLSEKVEIIEEPNKIEKLELCMEYNYEEVNDNLEKDMKTLVFKINELIDEINNLKEND